MANTERTIIEAQTTARAQAQLALAALDYYAILVRRPPYVGDRTSDIIYSAKAEDLFDVCRCAVNLASHVAGHDYDYAEIYQHGAPPVLLHCFIGSNVSAVGSGGKLIEREIAKQEEL